MAITRRVGLIVGAAAVAAACSHTTPGSPRPAAALPQVSSAPAAPAMSSDERAIRDTLIGFQDAINSQNWDAYLDLMCAPMRAKFTGIAMDYLKKMRAQSGVTTVKITSVKIDGDNATAYFDSTNESMGSASVSLPLKQEGDGWKICQT